MAKKAKPTTSAGARTGLPFQVRKVNFMNDLDHFVARAQLLAECVKIAINSGAITGTGIGRLSVYLDNFEQVRWGQERG